MRQPSRFQGLLSAVLAVGAFGATTAFAQPILVDDDNVECPTATFTTIQAAVDAAAAGATVKVCPGVYNEQVEIPKRLRLEGDNGTVVAPAPMAANTTNLFSGGDIAAAILVTAPVGNVTITSLIVDGEGNGIAGCSPVLVGIYYRNASGTVLDVAVRNLKVTDPECDSGVGVFAQSGAGGASAVTVRNTSVHDYQKSGIIANEAGTTLTADRNVVKGSGSTLGTTQNGIQVGFGATGRLTGNTTFDHIAEDCVDVLCSTAAVGILVLESDGVRALNNTVASNQVGLFVQGNNGQFNNNNIFGTDIFDGVVVDGNGNQVLTNSITGTDRSSVLISGDSNTVRANRINEATIGIWTLDGSGNIVSNNVIVNTLTPLFSGPAPITAAASAEASSASSAGGVPALR